MNNLFNIYSETKSHARGKGGAARNVELEIMSQISKILPDSLVEHEEFYSESDPLHKTDIIINQKTFIHVQKDLWNGSFQQDRLKVALAKSANKNILYLVFDPGLSDYLDSNPRSGSTKSRVIQSLNNLISNKTLHTEHTIYEHLLNIYK